MQTDWVDVALRYLMFIPILTVHEWAHAWAAHRCGDDTAKSAGRMTLDPIPHMDRLGTVILPLLGLITGGFIIGWGKPVPVNPARMRHPRRDDVLVSLAGPFSNLVLAFLVLGTIRIALLLPSAQSAIESFASYGLEMALISIFLGLFNLLPVPPLDGSHLLRHVVRMSPATYMRISRYGFFAVIVLFVVFDFGRWLGIAAFWGLAGMMRLLGFPA